MAVFPWKPFYISSLEFDDAGGKGELKCIVTPDSDVSFTNWAGNDQVTKELAKQVRKVRCLASGTPKQSANWLHFSLSVD